MAEGPRPAGSAQAEGTPEQQGHRCRLELQCPAEVRMQDRAAPQGSSDVSLEAEFCPEWLLS